MPIESSIEPRAPEAYRSPGIPIIALGGGVTLSGVLNILRRSHISWYALCPEKDFVRRSRWYHPLPTALPNPRPSDLEALLDSLDIETAVLLPCSDDWLRAVTALPASLALRFPSSTWKSADELTDKWRFAELLERHGLPRPGTHLIASPEQFTALPDSDFEGAILKPLSSVEFACKHGVKGYFVESRSQASSLLEQLELPIMLQEFIPGPPGAGYFLDGFRDRTGRITALFARRRLRMHPARLGNSTFIESVPLRSLHGAVFPLEHLLEAISYRGIFSAEFKYDGRDRLFKLIEINARPWWYVEFAARCGVDVCTMAYRDALGLPVHPVLDYQVGRRCVFALNDLRGWKQSAGRPGVSLFSLLGTWLTSLSTPFHWNDPLPALSYFGQTVGDFLHATLEPEAAATSESHVPTGLPADPSSRTAGPAAPNTVSAK